MNTDLEAYIERVVDRAPALTGDQIQTLRPLLGQMHEPEVPRAQSVYFIRSDGPAGEIKIGLSYSPEKRLRELQVGSAFPLEIIGVIPGGGWRKERELHARFAHLRLSGEWFRPGADLWAYIESLDPENTPLPPVPQPVPYTPGKLPDGLRKYQERKRLEREAQT